MEYPLGTVRLRALIQKDVPREYPPLSGECIHLHLWQFVRFAFPSSRAIYYGVTAEGGGVAVAGPTGSHGLTLPSRRHSLTP